MEHASGGCYEGKGSRNPGRVVARWFWAKEVLKENNKKCPVGGYNEGSSNPVV